MSETISLFLKNEDATQSLGRSLANVFSQYLVVDDNNLIVTLDGQLGTGKTTLVRATLQALGVTGAIKSPTYTLLEPYEIELSTSKKRLKIAHLDLYRLQEPEELDYIGGRNLANDYDLVLIEWPDKGQGFLSRPKIKVQLDHRDRGRTARLEIKDKSLLEALKEIKNK